MRCHPIVIKNKRPNLEKWLATDNVYEEIYRFLEIWDRKSDVIRAAQSRQSGLGTLWHSVLRFR
jgi:hypothetical protein